MSFLPEHFLPHKELGSRAKLLRHSSILSYIFFIGALIFTTHLISYNFPNVLGFASNISAADLLKYTNEARAKNGEKPLVLNSELSSAAYNKARDMFKDDYWAHVSPSGKEPWDFIVGSGYDYMYAGENLARDFNNSSSVVEAWLNSPSHRDNILSANYNDIGFAVVNGVLDGRETTLVVQMFGRSRNPEYKASITPSAEVSPQVLVQTNAVQGEEAGKVLPAVDMFSVSRGVSLSLGLFLALLLMLDFWYVKSQGIVRISGNTLAHILFLVLALIGVWYANVGVVL